MAVKNRNRQLGFEVQSSHVVRRRKKDCPGLHLESSMVVLKFQLEATEEYFFPGW